MLPLKRQIVFKRLISEGKGKKVGWWKDKWKLQWAQIPQNILQHQIQSCTQISQLGTRGPSLFHLYNANFRYGLIKVHAITGCFPNIPCTVSSLLNRNLSLPTRINFSVSFSLPFLFFLLYFGTLSYTNCKNS